MLLSGRGEVEAEQAERVIQNSGVEWTILRASWFFQNFSESHFLGPILQGELALPVWNIAEPFTDAEDIAENAVEALTQPGHSGQLYELTGPRVLTFAEAVDEIARETKRDIRFAAVPPGAYRQAWRQRRARHRQPFFGGKQIPRLGFNRIENKPTVSAGTHQGGDR